MRAAKYDIATGLIAGVRSGDALPPLPEGMAYLELAADDPCDPDRTRVVDGVLAPRLALDATALDRMRRDRREVAKAVRDSVIDGLCPTPLGIVQSPPASRMNITGLVTMATLAKASDAPFRQVFRMADNSMIEHDADQMIALGFAVAHHVAACSAAYFAIADAINASDEPATIDIHAGYPAAGDEP